MIVKGTQLIVLLLAFNFFAYTKCDKESCDSNISNATSIFPEGQRGPDKLFTGNAYNYSIVAPDTVYSTLAGNVYFEPGARSNWHTHPAGQILIITEGVGYHQIEGQSIDIIRKGDVVKCPPNVRHWHGASPDTALQQMYIVPNIEKGIVNWMESVSDSIYLSK